jgi:O-antigen ligase
MNGSSNQCAAPAFDKTFLSILNWVLLGGLLAFAPLLEGGTTHVAVMVMRFLIVAGLCLCLVQGLREGTMPLPWSGPWQAGLAFIGITVLTTIGSPYRGQSIQWLLLVLAYAGTFYWVSVFLRCWAHAALLLAIPVGMGVVEAVLALGQTWLGQARSSGTFFNPNFLAGYLAAGWCIVLAALVYSRIHRRRGAVLPRGETIRVLGGVAILALLLAVIVLTGSRGGLLALLAGSVLVLGARFGARAGLILAAVLVGVMIAIPNPLRERVLAEHEANPVSYARWQIWQGALRMMADHPAGIGPGLYQYLYPRYAFPIEGQIARYGKVAQTPHNEYLQIGVEMGTAGLLIFLAGLGLVGRDAAAVLRRRMRRRHRGLFVGAGGAAAAILVHAGVDSNLHEPGIALVLLLSLAVLLAGSRLSGPEPWPGWHAWRLTPPWLWAGAGALLAAGLLVVSLRMGLAWLAYADGFAAAERKDLGTAAERHRTAVELDSGRALYHSALAATLAQMFEETGDRARGDTAVREFERTLALNPLDGRLVGQLARLHAERAGFETEPAQRQAERQRALALYEQAVQLEPFNPFHRLEAARLQAMLGEHERAEALVRAALVLEPNFLNGRAWLVRHAVKNGRVDKARREYGEIVARRARYAGAPKDGYEARLLTVDIEMLDSVLRSAAAPS